MMLKKIELLRESEEDKTYRYDTALSLKYELYL